MPLRCLEHSTMFHGVSNLGDVDENRLDHSPDVNCIIGGGTLSGLSCGDSDGVGRRKSSRFTRLSNP